MRRGEAISPLEQQRRNLSLAEAEELAIYPEGSIGYAFKRYRRSQTWRDKAPATREDWWRVWRFIKPVFADVDPATLNRSATMIRIVF